MKPLVVGARTGKRLPKGEVGLVIGLAGQENNRLLGFETDEGIEIVSGLDSANNPVHKTAGKPAGHLGSALSQAHGMPCSTVVDRMLQIK